MRAAQVISPVDFLCTASATSFATCVSRFKNTHEVFYAAPL